MLDILADASYKAEMLQLQEHSNITSNTSIKEDDTRKHKQQQHRPRLLIRKLCLCNVACTGSPYLLDMQANAAQMQVKCSIITQNMYKVRLYKVACAVHGNV